jgi:predicted dinucleotide-binding enzyme
MKIAIMGAGQVGSALAKGWAKAGHEIFLGVRDPQNEKYKDLVSENISLCTIKDAAKNGEVILMALPPNSVEEVCRQMGDVSSKVIIDAMNSFSSKPTPYDNTGEALKAWTESKDVVKCFNTIGYEGMKNADYNGIHADMFTAGYSDRGKELAKKLSADLGFENCYDFGGDDKFELLEQLAFAWINLAIFQKTGRDIAFKLLKR